MCVEFFFSTLVFVRLKIIDLCILERFYRKTINENTYNIPVNGV